MLTGAHLVLVGSVPGQDRVIQALGEDGAFVRTCSDPAVFAELGWDGDLAMLLPPLADDPNSAIRFLTQLTDTRPRAWRILATGNTDLNHLVRAVNQGQANAILPWPCPMGTLLDHCRHGVLQRRSATDQGSGRIGEITALRRELEECHRQLADWEQRSNISHLVRGMAHEFNNPLSAIMGHGERLQRLVGEDEDLRRRAGIVVNEARRCADLVGRLRQFASPPPSSTQVCEPMKLLQHAHQQLAEEVAPVPEIVCAHNVPPVLGAPRPLTKALVQILDNARLAGAGSLLLSAEETEDFVILVLANDGETPETGVIRQALSPFFTTRGGEGHRGLGLSLAAALVRDMGGSLTVDKREAEQQGMRCLLTLPKPAQRSTAVFGRSDDTAGHDILLVDDEPLITELISDVLQSAGCQVTACSTLADADQQLSHRSFTGVVCDVSLPDGSGTEFLRDLAKRRPELVGHIAIVTGDPEDIETQVCIQDLDCPLIAKPFRISDLQRLVEQIV